MHTSDHTPTRRPGPLRRLGSLVRSWFFGGGCRACRSHEDDIERWRGELDKRYGDEDANKSDHSR